MARLCVLAGVLLALLGCATDVPEPSSSPSLPTLPGPPQHLPAGAASGTSWVRADERLPSGIDRTARYPTAEAAFIPLTEPFGRRQLPAGLQGEVIKSEANEEWILITIPTVGNSKRGEQFLFVLREDAGGWILAEAWTRDLCAGDIDHEACR